MADIRCTHCGKDNPDFLDVCQFCQSPLKSESMLHIGDQPVKKSTGELEPILPDWLKDVRQQARESTDEDVPQTGSHSKVQKEEAPDLLAGLAFQSASEEDEIPDWLAGLSPVEEKAPSVPAAEPVSDFFVRFEQGENQPEVSAPVEAVPEEPAKVEGERDELSEWISQASSEKTEPFSETGALQGEKGRMDDAGFSKTPYQEPAAETEPEDLGWLRDLEASAKQAKEPPAPQQKMDFPFAQPSSQEDLSWLNNLGGTSVPPIGEEIPAGTAVPSEESPDWLKSLSSVEQEPSFEETPTLPPSFPKEDLSWLNTLGGTLVPAFAEEIPPQDQADSTQEDLSWLKNLGGLEQPVSIEEMPAQPSADLQDDLSWLTNLGGTEELPASETASSQPFADESGMDWLSNLGAQQEPETPPAPVAPFVPRRTAPLESEPDDSIPDWLKEAMEGPSMPLGAAALDKLTSKEIPADEKPPLSAPEPASVESEFAAPVSDAASMSSQELDSMFAVEMPDWLSREPGSAEAPAQDVSIPSPKEEESLAPVELPSWVQAMRPVESVIEETTAGVVDEVVEREGPLAGFSGVIPFAPIGSSRRPRPFSLKLQATDEQQANASLLERIITSETAPQALRPSPTVASQRLLRWALAALFLLVLGAIISLGSQNMPVVPPAGIKELSNIVMTIPDGFPVLIVVDYEPALAGEMEAAGGPLLDQLALSRHSKFTFLTTSPNGSALVERLMTSARINKPAPEGAGYQPGMQYFNIGFLPGGSAGVLGFMENPTMAMPLSNINNFADIAAVVILTDHSESGRVWIEQLEQLKGGNPALASQALLLVSSAQAGPMLQPYVSSGQVDGMVNGLVGAAGYEVVNNNRPGTARVYWDAFGVGLMMAVITIGLGSLWSLFTVMRARRAVAGQGKPS
jgi:hypothetical protein